MWRRAVPRTCMTLRTRASLDVLLLRSRSNSADSRSRSSHDCATQYKIKASHIKCSFSCARIKSRHSCERDTNPPGGGVIPSAPTPKTSHAPGARSCPASARALPRMSTGCCHGLALVLLAYLANLGVLPCSIRRLACRCGAPRVMTLWRQSQKQALQHNTSLVWAGHTTTCLHSATRTNTHTN